MMPVYAHLYQGVVSEVDRDVTLAAMTACLPTNFGMRIVDIRFYAYSSFHTITFGIKTVDVLADFPSFHTTIGIRLTMFQLILPCP
jgi:hypothetical protein